VIHKGDESGNNMTVKYRLPSGLEIFGLPTNPGLLEGLGSLMAANEVISHGELLIHSEIELISGYRAWQNIWTKGICLISI
jgi:hypothetical protein